MMAVPNTSALVKKMTPHNGHGAPSSSRACRRRTVRAWLTLSRLLSVVVNRLRWASVDTPSSPYARYTASSARSASGVLDWFPPGHSCNAA